MTLLAELSNLKRQSIDEALDIKKVTLKIKPGQEKIPGLMKTMATCRASAPAEDGTFILQGDAKDVDKCLSAFKGKYELVQEAYDTSADWDADHDKLERLIKDALAIMNSPNWQMHMKDTDDNYSVDAVDASDEVHNALEQARDALKVLMSRMLEAQ